MTFKARLIKECVANIEYKVLDVEERHNIVVLGRVAAHIDPARDEKRMAHAVGGGTAIVDGRRRMMDSKASAGL